jgi:hypothetical protein
MPREYLSTAGKIYHIEISTTYINWWNPKLRVDLSLILENTGTNKGYYNRDIPSNIYANYNLKPLENNGHVIVEIRKGLYSLPQLVIIANDRLVTQLNYHG